MVGSRGGRVMGVVESRGGEGLGVQVWGGEGRGPGVV